jgi:hypothetical protein
MLMDVKTRIEASARVAPEPAPAGAGSSAGAAATGPELTGHAFWDTQPVPKLCKLIISLIVCYFLDHTLSILLV